MASLMERVRWDTEEACSTDAHRTLVRLTSLWVCEWKRKGTRIGTNQEWRGEGHVVCE